MRRETDKTLDGKYRGQYESQLNVVVGEVDGAAELLSESLRQLEVPEPLDLGTYYAKCRGVDVRTLWLRKAWGFYRLKFDQRDDPDIGPALRAVDEVVWSCYKPFFQRKGGTVEAIPLAYIDPEYSPAALERYKVSAALPDQDADLKKAIQGHFETLPLPVLRLPPTIVTSPWLLPLVAHEIGHFVYPLIMPESAFGRQFQQLVQAAAARAGANEDDQIAWKKCAPEIFSDFYAVVTMGPWAFWAIDLLDRRSDATMLKRQPPYPARLARLFLMCETARLLGVANALDLLKQILGPSCPLLESPAIAGDLRIATAIAEDLHTHKLPGELGTLASIFDFRAEEFDDGIADASAPSVATWSSMLRKLAPMVAKGQLRMARLIAAGAAHARWEIMKQPAGAARQAAVEAIDQTVQSALINTGEPGKRSGQVRSLTREGRGEELAKILLSAPDSGLGLDAEAEE